MLKFCHIILVFPVEARSGPQTGPRSGRRGGPPTLPGARSDICSTWGSVGGGLIAEDTNKDVLFKKKKVCFAVAKTRAFGEHLQVPR